MKYAFYVITKVPNILEQGNMANDFMYEGQDSDGDKIICIGMTNKSIKPIGDCFVSVFEEGEIVICNTADGREVCYPGRKPSKWDVEYEVFDNLNGAVKRAQELL